MGLPCRLKVYYLQVIFMFFFSLDTFTFVGYTQHKVSVQIDCKKLKPTSYRLQPTHQLGCNEVVLSDLDFRTWTFRLGLSDLDFRTWTFGLGLSDLDFRTWTPC